MDALVVNRQLHQAPLLGGAFLLPNSSPELTSQPRAQAKNPLKSLGSVSSDVAFGLRLSCRMRRRLASAKQEEVSVSHSCSSKGLLIVENAG